MTSPCAERIRTLLGGPRYEKLFAAARRRVEEAGEEARSVALPELDGAERRALADLLGWNALPDGPGRLDLVRLDASLRESAAGASLRDVLEALGGPLRDRPSERRAERDGRERMWLEARAQVLSAGRPELAEWIDGLRSSGALARAARAAGREEPALLDAATRVVLGLPAPGRLLPVFAASSTGDPHALDAGTPLGSIVLRAAAAIAGRSAAPASAFERRALWREVGIDCDSLSAEVLVLGLRPAGRDRLCRHLRESAEDGEPGRVTLRELSRATISVEPGTPVFVCENPAVVEAAADALGDGCAALVCAEGVPSTAAMQLLRGLAASGAQIHAHADFDWAGLRIVAQVVAETRAKPWRFGSADYSGAIAGGRTGAALAGPPAPSPWDDLLARKMAEAGVAVPEERVLAHLLADLQARRRASTC